MSSVVVEVGPDILPQLGRMPRRRSTRCLPTASSCFWSGVGPDSVAASSPASRPTSVWEP